MWSVAFSAFFTSLTTCPSLRPGMSGVEVLKAIQQLDESA
jgi:hypothetical protein